MQKDERRGRESAASRDPCAPYLNRGAVKRFVIAAEATHISTRGLEQGGLSRHKGCRPHIATAHTTPTTYFITPPTTRPIDPSGLNFHLGNNLRCVLYAGEVCDLLDVLLGFLEHALILQKQDVLWVRLGSLPPLQDVVEP